MEEELRQVTGANVTFSRLELLKMVCLTDGFQVSIVNRANGAKERIRGNGSK